MGGARLLASVAPKLVTSPGMQPLSDLMEHGDTGGLTFEQLAPFYKEAVGHVQHAHALFGSRSDLEKDISTEDYPAQLKVGPH